MTVLAVVLLLGLFALMLAIPLAVAALAVYALVGLATATIRAARHRRARR